MLTYTVFLQILMLAEERLLKDLLRNPCLEFPEVALHIGNYLHDTAPTS